jgi:hypothetical protein
MTANSSPVLCEGLVGPPARRDGFIFYAEFAKISRHGAPAASGADVNLTPCGNNPVFHIDHTGKKKMNVSIDRTRSATVSNATAAARKEKATHARFVGSIPQIYDEHLGPLLFEFAAADLARRVGEALPGAGEVLEIACGTGISTGCLILPGKSGARSAT